jgi:glutathione synthase
MDPIDSIDIDADTTFALMLEAQDRGHRNFVIDQADLGVDRGRPTARMREATLRRERGRHADLGEVQHAVLDDHFDVVWQRRDPPVDENYIRITQMLTLCHRARVLNRPESILASNEKLYALHHPELMADTVVTRRIPELVDFMAAMGGEMIVKPLDGRGGEGIFLARHDDRNLFSILEQATSFGERWTMAQRYLHQVRKGDKRILLLEGEFLGALLRVPAEGEVRANLHVGGRAAEGILDDDDRRIIDALAPQLRKDGFFFVGIDVIGGKLTEINVTSPTGIQEASRLSGENLCARVIERLQALTAP